MAGLFSILDIASRSLLVNQSGIRTTGHNIANVNTPGYSRQRQVLETGIPETHASGNLGTGVEQASIERITDEFVQRQLIGEHASSGSTDVQAEALSQIEEILNEQTGEGISSALSDFYASFQELASATTPGAPAERVQVQSAARVLIDRIHRSDRQLRDLQQSEDRSISGLIGEINQLATQIAELNGEIRRQEVVAPANDLRDRQEELLRQLAQKVEISTFQQGDGTTVVMVGRGNTLVEGVQARSLVKIGDPTNPFDPTFSRVAFDDGAVQTDITADIGGGELGGVLRARDTLIPDAIRELDTLAYNLAVQVNAVHVGGVGLDGTVGDFFLAPPAVEDAARDLQLDPAVDARPEAIAAALGPAPAAPGDNRNALALAALVDQATPLFRPGDPPGPPTGPTQTLLDFVSGVESRIGSQSRSLQAARDQQERVLEVIQNRRDEISGVSLDEEMTQLIRLQAAFQANVRVVSAVDRLLQDVIGIL